MDEPHPLLAWLLVLGCVVMVFSGNDNLVYLGLFAGFGLIAATWRVLLSSFGAPFRYVFVTRPRRRASKRRARAFEAEVERERRRKAERERAEAARNQKFLEDIKKSLDDL